jgi:hypothetical protein
MATREDVYKAILNADKAGDGDAVRTLGAYLKQMDGEPAPQEFRASVDSQKANEARSPAYVAGASRERRFKDSIAQAQGPAFGFLDEAAGAVVGGAKTLFNDKPYSQNYTDVRDYVRGATDAGMRENPIRNMAGQVALSAPMGLAGAAKLGGGKVAQLLASMGIGGAASALNGLGSSDKSIVDDPAGVAKDAGTAGLVGAILPPVVSTGVRGGAAVVGNVASRFSESAAGNYALRKVAEAFARDNPKVADAAGQAVARIGKLGEEARVVDTGGASVRGALDTLATLPGETKNAVEAAIRQRQATRGGRMIEAANAGLGANGQRLAPTLENLISERKAAAAPLYADLYKQGVFINDDLRQIIDAAHKLGAGTEAGRIATAEMRRYGLNPEAQWSGMRELDYLKQGLDDIILANKNPQTGQLTKVGAAVQGLKTDLVGVLDSATNGAYARARAAYAGPSSVIDAANEGRKALTRDDAAIGSIIRGMGPAELDGFRIGAFEALRAKLGKEAGQTEILKMWKEPATQEKLKAIFPDERSFREFAARVAAEGRMKGLDAVGRGSQTAARQYGAGDLDVEAGKAAGAAIADAKTGNIAGLVAKGADAWNRVATPEPVRDAMGRILLSQGATGRNELVNLQDVARQIAAARKRGAATMGFGTAPGGNALMQFVTPRDDKDNPFSKLVY